VGTNDYLKANQVWMASLTYGCSKSKAASNYMAAPDVEECCKWQAVVASEVRGASAVLTFDGDIKMIDPSINPSRRERMPSTNAFCEQFLQSLHDDLSCALGVPHVLIKVIPFQVSKKPRLGCSFFTESFEIGVDLFPVATTEAITGLPAPADLAQQLQDQHGDVSSPLWKGYLTKMLKVDATPSITIHSAPPSTSNAPTSSAPMGTSDLPTGSSDASSSDSTQDAVSHASSVHMQYAIALLWGMLVLA